MNSSTWLEAPVVQPRGDLTIGGTGDATREGPLDGLCLLGNHLRWACRIDAPVAKGHRTGGQAGFCALAQALHDVNAELIREELGHAPDHREHEPTGGRAEIEVLRDADKAHPCPTERLQCFTLDGHVPRPSVDRVHDDEVEVPDRGVRQQRGQCRASGDLVAVCAHTFVGVDPGEPVVGAVTVPLDLATLRRQGVAFDLTLVGHADVGDCTAGGHSGSSASASRSRSRIARTTSA